MKESVPLQLISPSLNSCSSGYKQDSFPTEWSYAKCQLLTDREHWHSNTAVIKSY